MDATRVLIADDSKLITKQISKALLTNKIDGYNFQEAYIYIAYDGMQAFEMLGKHPEISLLISDVNMPELNGDELIEILIDTQKISSLDVVFVTTKSMVKHISPVTSKHTLGTIYKPFNVDSFALEFNELLAKKEQKSEELLDFKNSLQEQKELLVSWIKSYCEKFEISYDETLLIPIIDTELDLDSSISKDELFSLFGSSVENYLLKIQSDHVVNTHDLKAIYVEWENPDDFKKIESPLQIKEKIIQAMHQAQNSLEIGSSVEDMQAELMDSMSILVTDIQKKCKTKQTLPYDDFVPYFQSVINLLLKIDSRFQQKRLDVLLHRIEEIKSVNLWLSESIESNAFLDEIPKLKSIPAVLNGLHEKLKTVMESLNKRMQNFVHEFEITLWYKAKKSTKIVNYLKRQLKGQIPHTHNLFFSLGKIDEKQMQAYEKYQQESVYILSSKMEILNVFQEVLVPKLPLWEISRFTNVALLQLRVTKKLPTKFIIDLNYQDTVFKNGLQLINILKKKYPGIDKIIENDGLIFMMTSSQAELLHKKAKGLRYRMILKPINKKSLFDTLVYVHTHI